VRGEVETLLRHAGVIQAWRQADARVVLVRELRARRRREQQRRAE
jgi:hypothetical protein